MNAVTSLPRLRSLHLGVDAQVALAAERRCGRRGDRADPELEGRTVGHEIGHVLPDPSLNVTDRLDPALVGRHVDLDGEIDVVHVDEALAERPWHRPIELDDHGLRGPDRGMHRLD
jgi:hypothetical protein